MAKVSSGGNPLVRCSNEVTQTSVKIRLDEQVLDDRMGPHGRDHQWRARRDLSQLFQFAPQKYCKFNNQTSTALPYLPTYVPHCSPTNTYKYECAVTHGRNENAHRCLHCLRSDRVCCRRSIIRLSFAA